MMDSIIKSDKALDLLTTISLAQFLVIVALFIKMTSIGYYF